ncbi:family 16 glycosylhydrolase [Alkalitalea saponilacus]|uniref:Por secretion system C-terminal sorting domain-containing protein n=1 Tax=Alkalitalea saponilacus TaxID=889453 RepID=A0A1T5CIE7_9BACT|nr:family 16 glycosylhydrolase [Alkalitalea saponilacus]ASB49870.1 hypothetical protein CDL62_12355 [Alkalitalea saponilacus]SKB58910.1 Por secretion system C-terminal sorting domain-containing protein [Alkalitalea saponilacus]
MKKCYIVLLKLFIAAFIMSATAQEYQLVWEENFEGAELNTSVWNYETEVGVWNWGANQELQHYRAENVEVGPDGEGNNALIITAKRESFGDYQFTSGRINTSGKVAALYGRIEARIKLPVLADGLWPAFWMLGTQNTWPASGEIDIMEAGHREGIDAGTQDRTFNGALHWEHAGNYAGYGPQWTAPEGASLYEYNVFVMEWTPQRIEMYFNDHPTPYFAMDITGEDAEEFRDWPHYFILNLAVGGSFPGITNPDDITAPLPAQMFVDYIRVYQREGEGVLVVSEPQTPQADYFGIFTENPSISERFVFDDFSNTLQVWDNSLQPLENAPSYDGAEVLSFYGYPARTWFGFGINAAAGMDFSHFSNGSLHLALRTSSDNDFWIGMGGAAEGRINFIEGSDPYGFQRDGQWYELSIPVSELVAAGLDLSDVRNIFMLGGDGAISNILVDDIYLSVDGQPLMNSELNPNRNDDLQLFENKIVADYYGIFTENPNVEEILLINDVDAHIYIWEGTLNNIQSSPYDGEEYLAFTSVGAGWWGFGIHDDKAADLSHFENGYLAFSVKASSQESFRVTITGASGTSGSFDFVTGSDPEGFERDGEWHRVRIPISSFASVDLSAVPIPFSVTQGPGSTSISDIAFDDIIYTTGIDPENPNLYDGSGEIGDPNGGDQGNWEYWFGDGGQGSVTFPSEHLATVNITNAGWQPWSVQLFKDNLDTPDGEYVLTFRARADAPRTLNVNFGKGLDAAPWFIEFMSPKEFNITTEWDTYSITINKENVEVVGKLVFEMGSTGGDNLITSVYIDDVSLELKNATNLPVASELRTEVYPNPASDNFIIYSEVNIADITVYSLAGVRVFETGNINSSSLSVNTYGWNDGVYVLVITDYNGERVSKRIVIKK